MNEHLQALIDSYQSISTAYHKTAGDITDLRRLMEQQQKDLSLAHNRLVANMPANKAVVNNGHVYVLSGNDLLSYPLA